ncbi:transferrin receptor-like dimerization domain-containing protein [Cognatiluteimonas profundi]|uniref:transferrin receptor-like dimerization domain-containing protein n=1 Tax=Cognatiluteimonas profundi TaxID=2594501 RepID=UPI001E2B74AA|nr:transferrin receptor-like dimerization domain-containing protein [Lysobacter profundi]
MTSAAGAASGAAPDVPVASASAMLGFTPGRAAEQRALEQRFDAALSATDQRDWLKRMSSEPNHVGSAHDKANAEWMLARFREWGWDARIETYSVLYPTPKTESLELVAPEHFKATLHEPPVAGDSTSATPGALPPYNAYGGDGDVTAGLVYANQGMPDDYKELARRGIDVRGKIVITRYGGGWRGLKPKLAQEHGAVGCLIYSDPRDDGYGAGDAYPKGGWRPQDGVQRGSVQDMQLYPGDPLTPGVGATPDAKRLAIKDAKTILKIPVLPISYADALPLLRALDGPMAPREWRGGLPIAYHLGGGNAAKAHLVVQSDWNRKDIHDVIAVMKGSTEPDQWILRGNHHDGWVFGAWDPLSGNVALLDEAKAIGALAKTGWRPKRTLVYASWDAEEPGLLGSTEFAEAHADELQRKAVAYINSDTNGHGFLGMEGSHSLQHVLNEVAAGVDDPETHVSVRERARAKMRIDGSSDSAKPQAREAATIAAKGGDLPIEALGSGSDYSAFLQHLGIASLNLGFGGEDDQDGVYHSRYDSFDHYDRFGDPGFAYGVALSKVAGHIALRMANADVLPMRFSDFSDTLGRYVADLHQTIDGMRKATASQHGLLDARVYALVSDPARPIGPPARDSDMPAIDLAPLDSAAKQLTQSAQAFESAYDARAAGGFKGTPGQQRAIDMAIARMEQALTDPDGLPGRGWYKHMIYAPGLLTGYGVKTVPGVREAIEQRQWEQANRYAVITARVLDGYRAQLDQLTTLMKQ